MLFSKLGINSLKGFFSGNLKINIVSKVYDRIK